LHCPRCETKATPGARFCRQCGVQLPGTAPAEEPADGAPAVADDGPGSAPRPTASDETSRQQPVRVAPDERDAGEGETAAISTAGVAAATRRTCPSCGAPNSVRRELCGRCGADLETGSTLPRPTQERPPEEPPDEPAGQAPGRRLLPLLFGIVLIVALIVLALGLAGLGPFAQQVGMPSAAFDEAAYPGEVDELVLTDIAARTTREASGNESFEPPQMADANPDTAWNNDGEQLGDGVGEVVDLFLSEPAWVERVVVTNGYQLDSDTYAAHARIKRAGINFDGGERVVANLLDLGLERQAVELPEPRLTTTVRIEVLETFPGDTFPDLAVSDIELEGWTADGEDVDIAVERAEMRRAAGAPVD
jgi:hypothetical protein